MDREKLDQQIKDIIKHYYGWDMWASRSQSTFDEGIQPFVEAIVEAAEQAATGQEFRQYGPDDNILGDLNVVVGGNIRRLRVQKGLSMAYMAETIDIDPDYYADLERGAAWMRTVDLKDIARILGVKSSALLPF